MVDLCEAKNRRYQDIVGSLFCFLLFTSPMIIVPGLNDFANLPKTVFVQSVVIILLLFCGLQVVLSRSIALRKNRVALFLALFLGWSLLSLIWTVNRYEGFLVAAHWVTCGILYFVIISDLVSERWLPAMLHVIGIAATFVSLFGLAQHFLSFSLIPQLVPPASFFGNKNMAAHFVSLALPIVWAFTIFAVSKPEKIIGILQIIISCLYLLVSQSRGGCLAALLGAIFVCMAQRQTHPLGDPRTEIRANGRNWPKGSGVTHERKNTNNSAVADRGNALKLRKITVIITLMLFMFGAVLCTKASKLRWGSKVLHMLVHEVSVGGIHGVQYVYRDTLGVRFDLWINSWAMFTDQPVMGCGIGNWKIYYPKYHQRMVRDRVFSEKQQPRMLHNDYLQVLVELGIIGFALFLGIMISALIMIRQVLSSTTATKTRRFEVACAGSLLALMISALFSFPLRKGIPPLVFFVCLGILTRYLSEKAGNGTLIKFRVPRKGALAFLVAFLIGGAFFTKINLNIIESDRCYQSLLRAEQSGHWPAAIAFGLKCVRLNPFRVDVMSHLGYAYVNSGNNKQGIQTLEKALSRYPYNINAMMNLAVAYSRDGETGAALNTFKRLLVLKPDYPRALGNMAMVYIRCHMYNKAEKVLQKAIYYDPQNTLLRKALGTLLVREGKYEEAVVQYKAALKYNAKDTSVYKALAALDYYLRNPQRTKFHMKRYDEVIAQPRPSMHHEP